MAPKAITSRGENHVNNYDAATEPSLHQQNKTVSNDLQDDVNISLNQSDSNPKVENDVNQDQPKILEKRSYVTHRRFIILLNITAILYIIDYFYVVFSIISVIDYCILLITFL